MSHQFSQTGAYDWPGTGKGNPALSRSYHQCKLCGMRFTHWYHNEMYEEAMKKAGINPDICYARRWV